MKRNLLPLFLLLSFAASAEEAVENYGFLQADNIQPGGYSLALHRVEVHKGQLGTGIFTFRWEGEDPVELWGLHRNKDGSFTMLFENTAHLVEGDWTATNFGHCGTGATLISFNPGKEYLLRISLRNFHGEKGGEGVALVVGEDIALVSDPFPVADLARAEEEGWKKWLEEVRSHP